MATVSATGTDVGGEVSWRVYRTPPFPGPGDSPAHACIRRNPSTSTSSSRPSLECARSRHCASKGPPCGWAVCRPLCMVICRCVCLFVCMFSGPINLCSEWPHGWPSSPAVPAELNCFRKFGDKNFHCLSSFFFYFLFSFIIQKLQFLFISYSFISILHHYTTFIGIHTEELHNFRWFVRRLNSIGDPGSNQHTMVIPGTKIPWSYLVPT